jgi:hypothetical protein
MLASAPPETVDPADDTAAGSVPTPAAPGTVAVTVPPEPAPVAPTTTAAHSAYDSYVAVAANREEKAEVRALGFVAVPVMPTACAARG